MTIKDTHGGHHGKGVLPKVADPGASGSGYVEADLAQRVNNAIIKYSGAKNTSDYLATNVNGNLANITKNMNKYPGDYHLSIHFNAYNSKATGIEVWYWAGDEPSRKKAVELAKELSDLTGLPNRGAKATTSFYVLRNSVGRTLLLELGFIDNKSDMAKVVPKIDAIGKKIAEVMGHKVASDTFDINKYHTKKFDRIELVRDDYAYKEVSLKTKVGSVVKKGTVLTVVGIEYSGKYPRFKLKSGLYISTRKDIVKEYGVTKTPTPPAPPAPKPPVDKRPRHTVETYWYHKDSAGHKAVVKFCEDNKWSYKIVTGSDKRIKIAVGTFSQSSTNKDKLEKFLRDKKYNYEVRT